MQQKQLEPVEPKEGVEWYLDEKEHENSPATVKAHEYRLNHFIRWCDQNSIDNLNTLTGRDLHRYKQWRRDDGDLNNVSLQTQLGTLRVFLKWAAKVDAVAEGLHDKILMPQLNKGENERDQKIDPEMAFEIINYLRTYKYASRDHVLFELMWHTAARLGGMHSLDVDDYHPSESYIEFNHRPETDTRLKNGFDGERPVALGEDVCTILDDYISNTRYEVTSQERRPLIASKDGRLSKSTMRQHIYRITHPCWHGAGCPDGKDELECEYSSNVDKAGGCPFNYNPHAIRRGSLTYHLLQDWSKENTSERADVSPAILEKHYDRRTAIEKLDQRRQDVKKL